MIADAMGMLFGKVEGMAGAAAPTLSLVILAFLFFIIGALFSILTGWTERKLIGRVHSRRGPVFTGPFGLLQTVADLFKFIRKEVIFPKGSDRRLFALAPILLCLPPFLALLLVPFGSFTVVRSEYGLLLVLALLSMGPIAILVGAWASNSKYSTLGGLRGAAMVMAYETLLGVALASVALAAGTFDIDAIAAYQATHGWFALYQPVAFVLFLIALVASSERNPFDLVEAESEIVAGWRTEYGGVYFSLTLLAEYIKILVMGLLTAAVFLGGWGGWGGEAAFMAKAFLPAVFLIYIRATGIRMQLERFFLVAWRTLIPLGLLNFIVTAALPLLLEALR